MGMNLNSGGSKDTIRPGMNVTPLVDVVLVLLIIFMVIGPLLAKQFWVHLPPQAKEELQSDAAASDDSEALVLSVAQDGSLTLSGNPVAEADLTDKLMRVFAARTDHVLFFDASDEAPYGAAVRIMDKARAGGALSIAILTERPANAAK